MAMGGLKRAYVAAARGAFALPFVAGWFDRAAAKGSPRQRWRASLLAIYQLERMVRLDIPWWNVAATDEVEAFLAARPGARVFEYGSGASSAWLAKRCGALIAVEHDRGWAENVARHVADRPHAEIRHTPLEDGAYVHSIEAAEGPFDLIVVDGRERTACLAAAIPRLAAGGIVLFDDSGRARYRTAIEGCGLAETHHHGRSYCVPYPDHTSILRRPEAG